MKECKCDYCGNPARNKTTNKCDDRSCYWYSHWMPMLNLSKEEAKEHKEDINDMNNW